MTSYGVSLVIQCKHVHPIGDLIDNDFGFNSIICCIVINGAPYITAVINGVNPL